MSFWRTGRRPVFNRRPRIRIVRDDDRPGSDTGAAHAFYWSLLIGAIVAAVLGSSLNSRALELDGVARVLGVLSAFVTAALVTWSIRWPGFTRIEPAQALAGVALSGGSLVLGLMAAGRSTPDLSLPGVVFYSLLLVAVGAGVSLASTTTPGSLLKLVQARPSASSGPSLGHFQGMPPTKPAGAAATVAGLRRLARRLSRRLRD